MKKTVVFGLLVIVLAFCFFGCNNDPEPVIVTYTGTANGETYVLKITDDTSFELTVSGKTSKGVASKNENTWTLTPSTGAAFTVTINSTGITSIIGTITFNDGNSKVGPGTVVPGNTPSPYAGTWENDEFQVRMVLANNLSFEFFDAKIIVGSWERFAKGFLEITNLNVTFTVTHLWVSANSTWSDEPSLLDSVKPYFGGSLTLNGTVNGSSTGSIMDFSPNGASMIKK